MLVEYNSYTVYCVYLLNKKIIIKIKDLKIIENINKKANSYFIFYNAITISKNYNTSNMLQFTLHSSL